MKSGIQLIAEERQRQIEKEGWSPDHDDHHNSDELLCAAVAYIEHAIAPTKPRFIPKIWPWESKWWKPKDRRPNLVRAGALIAAELDRMNREGIQAFGQERKAVP